MSDYFGKDPNKPQNRPSELNPWQQDPFAAYDDPSINPSGTGAPLDEAEQSDAPYTPPQPKVPDYSAWRRPDTARPDAQRVSQPATQEDAYAQTPDFAAMPAFGISQPAADAEDAGFGIVAADAGAPKNAFGANRGAFAGYGAPKQPADNSFAAMGADAPTRIARPLVSPQMVNKHKTVDRSAANPFERSGIPAEPAVAAMAASQPVSDAQPEEGAPRRRRVSRAARYEEAGGLPPTLPESFAADLPPSQRQAAPESALPPEGRQRPERVMPAFDPFEAGDSEAAPLGENDHTEPIADEPPRPVRRPAVPGERYTGARTALPQSGAPLRRDPSLAPATEDERLAPDMPPATQRPAAPQAQRPQGVPGLGPQGQRPVQLDANGRPIPTQRPQGVPGQAGIAQRPQGAPGQIPQGQRPPQLDANGRPIPAQRPQGAPGQMPQGQRPPQLDANGRPIPAQRPQGAPGQAPQGQRPVRLDAEGRPIAPQGMPAQRPQAQRPMQDDPYAARAPEGFDPRRRMRMEDEPEEPARFDPRRTYPEAQPRASVNRPAYDFENDAEDGEPVRRGGVLIPLVVVLLVIGSLLAGIALPDWDGMGGGLGTAMGKVKGAVVGAFESVKSLISPEEAGVKSITVSTTAATAPVELVFTVQASASVTDIRIVDQDGTELLSKTLTDSDMLGGEVTKNSKNNIWTLRYTYENAYSGVFTAQAMKKDGTWDEGMTLVEPVTIAPPAVVEPPVQSFDTDTTTGVAPATIGFTVVTSLDVTGVQIVNDYGDVVTEAYLSDAGAQVLESGETRTWSLSAQMPDAYTGSFFAGYQTDTDLTFTQSDYSVDVTVTAEDEAALNADALPASSLGDENVDDATVDDTIAADAAADDAANADVVGGDTPVESPVAEATVEPVAVADAAQTATPEPSVAPEATPAQTPLPVLSVVADAAAAPSAIKLETKAYVDLKLKESFERTEKIVMNDPFKYAVWDQSGILTFRGGPFRQNAAYGTAEITQKTLTEMWKVPVEGSIKAKSATLSGVGWPGQAIIVKWPTQLRAILGINDASKTKQALKEAIVGAQNGKIYFLDLVTGEATRDPIENNWPSNGALSLQTNASPMLAVGQHIGVLATKTVDNGLHLFNLLSNKELTLLKGKDKLMRSNYSGFNGAPLFDKNTGAMIVGGENGLFYTLEMGDEFDHVLGTLKISPAYQRYTWLANKQKAKNTNIDGGVAMYGPYAYFADQTGIVQCVDVNTLTPVWAVDTGDNVDATVALDMQNDTTVSLYTANTLLNQGRTGVCTIRSLDALTGKQNWAYTVTDVTYTTEAEVGVYASPVVGQNKVSDMVFFTATNGTKGAILLALDKATGTLKWSLPLTSPTLSSPVAVYNEAGDAWLLQAESNGTLSLIDAKTGTVQTTLKLDGTVEASPAVYRDVVVISTTGSSYIYGIKLE